MEIASTYTLQETLHITNSDDVIVARMRTREYARELGLDTISQACISLVVTTLAGKINLGSGYPGRVEISALSKYPHLGGMRVDLITTGVGCQQYQAAAQDETSMHLLDEFFTKCVSDNELVVTAIKWMGLGNFLDRNR